MVLVMTDKNFIAVDIGGTKISIVLFRNDKIVNQVKLQTNPIDKPTTNKPKLIADNIINGILNLGVSTNQIGIATTGVINDGNWSVLNKKILGEFKKFPLCNYIESKLNTPVFAISDTEAAALGEFKFGAGIKLSEFFYITVSTGVGGGMVLNNQLYRKSPNLAGAFGHMVIVQNGKLCGCGRKGCIEAYSSGTALKQMLEHSEYKDLSVKDILLTKSDQTWVIDLIKEAAIYLSEGIVNVNSLLGIKNFIIGGSIGLNENFFNEIKNQTSLITSDKINLRKAKLKNNTEVFGCLAYSSEHRKAYI